MPRKLRQLRAELRALGFYLARQVGSHETWRHACGHQVLLAGADGNDVKPYQERLLREAHAAVERAARASRGE